MDIKQLIKICSVNGNEVAQIAGNQVIVQTVSGAKVVLSPANDIVSLQRQAQAHGILISSDIPEEPQAKPETMLDLNIKGKTEPEVVLKKKRGRPFKDSASN